MKYLYAYEDPYGKNAFSRKSENRKRIVPVQYSKQARGYSAMHASASSHTELLLWSPLWNLPAQGLLLGGPSAGDASQKRVGASLTVIEESAASNEKCESAH